MSRPSTPPLFWKELSKDAASCVKLVHHTLHLSFPPYCIGDLEKIVQTEIDSRLFHYEKELGGILAGYGRITIRNSLDNPPLNLSDIPINVEGDFYIFKPEVGQQLSGVVNRKAYGHIGCLVHENFNIRLPQPYSVSNEEWLGKTAQLQDIVKFTITRIDLQNKEPYIEGNILELSLGRPRSYSDSGIISEESSSTSEGKRMPENKRSKLSLSRRSSIASPAASKSKENDQMSSSTPLPKSDIRKFLVRSNEKSSKKPSDTSLSTDPEASKDEDPAPTIDEKSKELTVTQDPEIFQALKDLFSAVSYKLSVRPVSAIASESVLTQTKSKKKKSLSSSREESSYQEVGAKASKTIEQEKRKKKKVMKKVEPQDREAMIQELLNCSRSSSI